MTYAVLTDEEVEQRLSMAEAVAAMEAAFEEHAAGTLVAPPRFSVDVDRGSLVFTAGAATGPAGVLGFRVYERFPDDSPGHTQLVAVFDSETGVFEGLAIGYAVGAMRTGAIGGVAIDHLAREECGTLAVLGSGRQARTQVAAATAVREFDQIQVYSPTRSHREAFADELTGTLDREVTAVDGSRAAVEDADVIVCATNSETPVLDADWVAPGAHVTTIGPKLASGHELPVGVAERSDVVATDSLAQVDGYDSFFLAATRHRDRMGELSGVVAGSTPGRTDDEERTLFCSVGLAGTEVVLASEAIRGSVDR